MEAGKHLKLSIYQEHADRLVAECLPSMWGVGSEA